MWFSLNIEEKDQNKTEVREAKTPLEITRLVQPAVSEELFMNEFLKVEKNVAETTVRMCCTYYITLKNSLENTCVSF